MTLDEATLALLRARNGDAPPLHAMQVEEARSMTRRMIELYGPGPDMHSVAELEIGSRPAVDVRVLTPTAQPRATIIYFHGGGWVLGSLDESDTFGRQLAQASNCAVVLVDYRLAPEHRYPAAVEDAWTVVEWFSNRGTAPLDGSRLIVAGDSAGGNLAAIVAQRADRERLPLTAQVLAYPVTDCDFTTASYTDDTNQLSLNRDAMEWFWSHYAPDVDMRQQPEASPLRGQLTPSIAPAVILAAEHDVLRSEVEAYAAALRQVGARVRYRCFEGQMHAFLTFVNVLPGSAIGLKYIVDELDQLLSEEESR